MVSRTRCSVLDASRRAVDADGNVDIPRGSPQAGSPRTGRFPLGRIPAYKSALPEPVPPAMSFAAIVRRIRSFSLSIGQLTFAQLHAAAGDDRDDERGQHRRDPPHRCDLCRTAAAAGCRRPRRGDRPAHERVAACGPRFRHRPGAQSDRVGEAASALNALLKKTRLELAPEQQDMIDGVDPAACELPRRHRARHRPDCAPRRTGRGIAADPRAVRIGDRRNVRPGRRQKPVPGAKPDRRGPAGARSRGRRAVRAAHAGAVDR